MPIPDNRKKQNQLTDQLFKRLWYKVIS